jgi:lipid-A-disaccharide synthase
MNELVVTVNAPGEVAGYVLPLAARLKTLDPGLAIRAVVTPCPFAGGREREALVASGVLDDVVDLRKYLWSLLRTRLWRRGRPKNTLVLHLGGDRLYSLVIARLLGAPAWVYGTSRHACRRYDRCLVPDQRTARKLSRSGVSQDRIVAVGEMVVDSVPDHVDAEALVRTLGLDPGRDEIVTLMAGSRPYEVDFMLPFYAGVLDDLARTRPSVRCLVPVSPFVDARALQRAVEQAALTIEVTGEKSRVRTAAGATADLIEGSPYPAMAVSRLTVTLPGTNTLQLAALGTPTLLVVPLNRVESIVVEGPINWLSPRWAPTRAIKRRLLFQMNRRLPFLALPNIIAGRTIVPEMRGMLTPAQVASEIARWLNDADGRRRMSAELREVAGARGAAERLATEVLCWERERCASGS